MARYCGVRQGGSIAQNPFYCTHCGGYGQLAEDAIKPTPYFTATPRLRFVERGHVTQSVRVLQQLWESETAPYEWRDVPLEKE